MALLRDAAAASVGVVAAMESGASATSLSLRSMPTPLPARETGAQLRARAWWIAGGYAAIASLWILFSDQALLTLGTDPDMLVRFSMYKGLAFVGVTALLLLVLIRRAFGQIATTYANLETSEREVQRIARLYAALSAINQAIVHHSDRDELFQLACRALVDKGGFAMTWVGWHDPDAQIITPVATYGEVVDYLDAISIRTDDSREGSGPSAVAISTGKAYVANDISTDEAWEPWRDAAQEHGLRAGASLPLRENGDIVGVMNVYAREIDYFQTEEIELLVEAAADISFGMDMLVREAQRQRAEAEVRALNVTLEARVAERTDALRSAIVQAEAADEAKSQFLATMSHELRTPLNSIIGFTGIISAGMAGPLTDEQLRQLGMVQSSARHLLALINDVLDLSKIEAGQLDVAVEPFDLVEIIDRSVEVITPLAQAKGLVLTSEIAEQVGSNAGRDHAQERHTQEDEIQRVPAHEGRVLDVDTQDGHDGAHSTYGLRRVFGDPRRVEQVLLNLLSNAVKFTESGQIRVTAGSAPGDTAPEPSGDHVHIDVHDTGIGIEPAEIEHLFTPFRQIDSGFGRSHEGTGLGLAICQRLATLMGGKVTVASAPRVGSTFTVVFPMDARSRS